MVTSIVSVRREGDRGTPVPQTLRGHHAPLPPDRGGTDRRCSRADDANATRAADDGKQRPQTKEAIERASRILHRTLGAWTLRFEMAGRRRPWNRHEARWVAENLLALRGWEVSVLGPLPAAPAVLLLAEPDPDAALAVLAAIPVAAVAPSLVAAGLDWAAAADAADGFTLCSLRDDAVFERLVGRGVVPVTVSSTPPPRLHIRFGEPLAAAA